MMRPGTHGHSFRSALRLDQWYRVPSSARKEDSYCDDREYRPTWYAEGKEKTVFNVRDTELHYSGEVENTMNIVFSRKSHHGSDYEETVSSWRKGSSNRKFLFFVEYGEHSNVFQRHS